MSIIAGGLIDSGFTLNGDIGTTPSLDSGLPALFPAEIIPVTPPAPVGGEVTIAAPISILPRAALLGGLVPSFGDIFFNRIHVLPNIINVGNLANKQTREIEIFNAFIETTQTLEVVTPNENLSGVDFDLIPPVAFAPFQSRFFELTINSAGSPSFNGFYSFEFSDATAPNLYVSGQRIIPFIFPHNWNELPVETIEYLTKVYESRADYETAQKLRPFPRRRLKYRHTALESSVPAEIAEMKAEMESVIYSWMHRPFALPIWEDLLFLTNSLSAGAVEIEGSTVGLDFDAGGYILFFRNSKTYELIEVESVEVNRVIFARPTELDWSAATLVLPARLARLAASVEFTGETEDILEFTTEWLLEADQQSENRVGTFTAPTYRTFPIYLPALRLSEQIATNISRKQTIIDYETGKRSVIASGVNPRGAFPISAVNLNRQEISAFYGFIDARAGKLNPCWFPSWANDLRLLETGAEAATSLTISGNRFSNVYAADSEAGKNRRDIMIRWLDDYKFYVRIESAAAIDETKENIFLSAPLPRLLTTANLDRISFLKFARLESDRVEITKETTNISRAEITLRELVAAE